MNGTKRALGLVVGFALMTGVVCGALQPAQLECEHRLNPLGLETPHPRLSWTLQSDGTSDRDGRQTAYQILVASSEKLLRPGQADLWDSGQVNSEQSVLVDYAGAPLAARQVAYWQVRVWDEAGRASAWSAPARWTMGLLQPTDWRPAQWIGAREAESPLRESSWIWTSEPSVEGRYPAGRRFFRKRLELAATTNLVQARILMTADNGFTLWVNGKEVLRGDQWDLAYDAEIRSLLVAGENVLAVEAVNAGSSDNEAGLIGQLELRLDDGRVISVPVDESWQSRISAPPGWQMSADDSGWSGVRKLGALGMKPWGEVRVLLAPPPVLRREFELTQPVRRATVFVSGLGHYELRLNGARIGDRVMDPGWTDYRDTCLYSTYDVTSQLRPGRNALGVMLGNGMYHVTGGRYVKFTGSFGSPQLILQLHLEHPDGSVTVIGTDDQWKTAPGPITFSCIYGGEDYDARLDLPGWDQPNFNDANWSTAQVSDGPGGTLRAQLAPPIKIIQELSTAKITEPQPGVFVYDLGQNFSGWPKLKVTGAAGTTVKMIPGELLDGAGLVSQRSSGGPVWFSYTLRGAGVETWSPRFSYYGFRYVQVEGAVPVRAAADHPDRAQVLELNGQWLHSSARVVGDFECSNPLLNQIHHLILAAIRCNLQSVLTDCPHREKLGWLEVPHLLGRGLMFNYALPNFYAKVSRDMDESQLANGLVPDIAPEYTVFSGGFRDSPEWGSAVAFNPAQVREFYGDASLLRNHFATLQRYTDYLSSQASQHIVAHGLDDWYDIGPKDPGPSQLTSLGLTATAVYYGNLQIVADTARQLGQTETAERYHRLATEVRDTFNARFFHPDSGRYDRGSQTAQAMPLVLGLVEPAHRDSVLAALVKSIREPGNRVTAGDVGFAYVVRALTDAGRSDVLYDLVTQTNGPGYADQLRKGATTLTEAWDADPRSSQNHCMLGHAEEWFYTGLAGIRPDPTAPGFKRFRLQPAIVGDLTWVKAHHDSPYGRIASAWRRTGNRLQLDVTIPPNTRATIFVPATDAHAVQESGQPASTARGLTFLRADNGRAIFDAGSGHYQFTSELPPP